MNQLPEKLQSRETERNATPPLRLREMHAARTMALAARKAGDHQRAVTLFRTAIDFDPGNGSNLVDLALELAALGDVDEARQCYDDARLCDPRNVAALRGLAQLARRAGDRAGAIAYLDEAISAQPSNLWLAAERAAELRDLPDFDAAERAYRDVLAKDPSFIPAHRGLAHVERRRGRRIEALRHFQNALEFAPGDVRALHDVASALHDLDRLDEAEAMCIRGLGLDPHFVPPRRLLAQIAKTRGRHSERISHLHMALDLDPRDLSTILDLAAAIRETGDLTQARELYQRAVDMDVTGLAALRGLALVARQEGSHGVALTHYQRVRELAPHDKWALFDVGMQFRLLRRYGEAAGLFRQVLAIDPTFTLARLRLAQSLHEAGDRDGSLQELEQLRSAAPHDLGMRTEIASLLRDLDHFEEAERQFRSILDEDGAWRPALRGFVFQLRRQGRHAEARRCLEDLIRAEGPSDAIVADLAGELRALGLIEDARRYLEGFMGSHAETPRCCLAYAQISTGLIDCDTRLALLQRAVETGPDLPAAACTLAHDYLRLGRPDEARLLLMRVLSRHPSHAPALLGLAHVARAEGQADEALSAIRQAQDANPTADGPLIELAREQARRGQVQEALACLEGARLQRPDSPLLAQEIGAHHRKVGDYAAAFDAYRTAAARFPDDLQLQVDAATAALHVGRLEDVQVSLASILRRDPQHVPALGLLGTIAQQANDLETAILAYDRCRQLAPQNISVALGLARCMARLGRSTEALAILEVLASRIGPLPELAVTESALRKGLGDLRGAQQCLLRNLAAFPRQMSVWAALTHQAIDLGDDDLVETLLAKIPPHSAQEAWHIPFLQGLRAMSQWDLEAAYRFFVQAAALPAAPGSTEEWAARAALLSADVDRCLHHLGRSAAADRVHLMNHAGQPRPLQTMIGQIADEYRLNPDVSASLRQAVQPAASLKTLADLVRTHPEFTPAALTYLVALRRRDQLAFVPDGDRHVIPRRITQFWTGDLPPDVEAHCRTWAQVSVDHDYRRFDDEGAYALLRQHFAEKVATAFLMAREPAKKADLFRLAYLSLFGGVYVDCDDVCTAPLSDLIPPGATLVLYQEDLGTVGNNVIATVPRHPVICHALGHAVEAILRCDNDMLFLSTGPGRVTRSLAAWIAHHPATPVPGLLVLERSRLYAGVSIHCTASYKHTNRHWVRSSFQHRRFDLTSLVALAGLPRGPEVLD